jgi:hypothetical protein
MAIQKAFEVEFWLPGSRTNVNVFKVAHCLIYVSQIYGSTDIYKLLDC